MKYLLIVITLLTPNALAWSPSGRGVSSLRRRVVPSVLQGGESRTLIIQNKGGGHGELGYHLAMELAKEKGQKVTILHDGGPEPKTGKEPWDSYEFLEAAGIEIKWADLSASTADALEGLGPFEHVYDNWAKDVAGATPLVQLAKEWDVSSFVFVSSAGMYKGSTQPMVEGDEVKETGQRAVEELLVAEGLPWTCFRPQYIYGPKTNKRDYIDWFFDRIVRGRPLPIPNQGDQIVSLTNAVDVASMLAAACGNPKAVNQVFNCGTDACVTYAEVASLVSGVVGKPAAVESYDPGQFPDLKKGAFPFRNTAFYVSVDKAKETLGWSPKSNLADDLAWYYQDYMKTGADKKEMDFATDEMLLSK